LREDKVRSEVAPVLNELKTKPRKRVVELKYSSTYSQAQYHIEGSG
jgi:hypothetical protein